ncbi:hypothetical protein RNI52_17830 [Labrys neptuniae]|uniref:hypothetical protein n=1 Tax=Labrys neptuniae TaxID=376174 RepID=UPI00288CD5B4|nr:hypothetical protein [Labrys neptuniae]MDT3379197.1 hypothetical protein [Labrys neptuniae]
MAKLGFTFDAAAHWIKKDLHRGRREEALARIAELIESGRAGTETRALAEQLAKAGKGRQPFGAKHLWIEIGEENERLRDAGIGYDERLAKLGGIYLLSARHLKTALRTYRVAMEEVRRIDEENR